MDLRDLLEQRGKLLKESRDMLEKAEGESRSLTEEEEVRYKKLHKDIADLTTRKQNIEAQQAAESEAGKDVQSEATRQKPDSGSGEAEEEARQKEYNDAFERHLRVGWSRMTPDEQRALSAGTDTEGGYTRPPDTFIARLLKGLDDMLWIRQRATTYQLEKSESIGVPTLEADPADADWTTELSTGNEDDQMELGKRALTPHPAAKRIKVSKTLLRVSALPIEQIVRERLTYKFGVTQEKGFMTGDGSGKPLGLFTASADGIPTSRDVSTGNTTTSITLDGLKSAKYALKQGYWRQAAFIFSGDAVMQIDKLKDDNGQYLWQPSNQVGEPDRLLSFPIMISEYAPSTFTAEQYVGMLGDYSYYWIADALDMELERLTELYAESNQMGYIGRFECDGQPVLPEAFVRIQLAAS